MKISEFKEKTKLKEYNLPIKETTKREGYYLVFAKNKKEAQKQIENDEYSLITENEEILECDYGELEEVKDEK